MMYCRLVLKVLLREPVLWAATASFALLLSLSALVPYPLYGPGLLRQVLRMNHESLSTNLASGAFDGAPNRLIDDINQQLAYMEDALSADTSSGFYATLAELYRANEEEVSSGTLVGSSALEAEVNVRYAEAMSEAGETPEYDSSTQLPALLLASVAPSTLPQFVLVILPLLIGLSVSMVTDWRKLLGSSTVSRSIAVLSRCIVGVIVCLVTFALSCLPFLAISTLKNGLGSPTYPIVFLRGGEIIQTTAGQAALWTAVLVFLSWLFLSSACICVSCVARSSIAGFCCALVLALVPSAPSYYLSDSLLGFPLAYMPLSYFCPWVVAGSVGLFPYVDLTPSISLDPWVGCRVLVVWGAGVIAFSALLALVRQSVAARQTRPSLGNGISLQEATVSYGDEILLSDVSFRMGKAEVVGLIAPNGAGKTTLLEILAGRERRLKAGVVSIEGVSPKDEQAYASQMFYAPSDKRLMYPHMSARFHIEVVQALYNHKVGTERIAESVGASDFLDKPVRTLSQGMVRQLSLCMAAASGAPFVLLDEPLNALDPNKSELAESCVRGMAETGSGIVISSHQPEEMDRICDRFLFLENENLTSVEVDGKETCRDLYHKFFGSFA